MRVRIVVKRKRRTPLAPRAPLTPLLSPTPAPSNPSRLPGLLSSVALHCAGALIVPQMVNRSTTPRLNAPEEPTYKVEYLNLKDSIYLPSDVAQNTGKVDSASNPVLEIPSDQSVPGQTSKPLQEPLLAANNPPQGRQSPPPHFPEDTHPTPPAAQPAIPEQASNTPHSRARHDQRPGVVPPPRSFEIPHIPARTTEQQIVLQAPEPPDLLPADSIQAPPLLFWAANSEPRVLEPPLEPLVSPGRPTVDLGVIPLDAPPILLAPKSAELMAGIGVAPQELFETPHLAAPPGAIRPIRVFQIPFPISKPRGTLERSQGVPVNVVSIPAPEFPLADRIAVPPGNQSPDFGSPVGLGLSAAPASPPQPGAEPASQKAHAASASPSGSPAGIGSLANEALPAERSIPGAAVPGVALTSSPSAPHAPAALPVARVLPPPGMRKVYASDGVYDLVVMQTDDRAMFPATAGVLTGKPIYTVYLDVGLQAEWMLKFCVPGSGSDTPRVRGSVVTLPSSEPLRAPYPRFTVAPPLSELPEEAYILVRGFISRDGYPAGLSLVRTADPEVEERLLSYLIQWQFRPATRGGRSVEVEFLLVIPRA